MELNKPTIEVSNAGKAYETQKRKRDVIKNIIIGSRIEREKFWALRNISFELKKGESLGIIGKNGSGKSTLLQLICGTLATTEGKIKTKGRIAALLELGSGFNPEFTGRENIYLNATLHGLKRKEIEKKIDYILEFADIGDFVDKPIRTYSSGMVVRLAFAIIANVEADILVIDEALAVGDAYFTQKCMRFIQKVREEKSLLFVSHDANSVLSLCDRAILLDKGQMIKIGTPKDVMEEYTKGLQKEMSQSASQSTIDENRRKKSIIKENFVSEELSIYKHRWQDYRTQLVNNTKNKNELVVKRFDGEELTTESFGGNLAQIIDVKLTNAETQDESNVIRGGEVVILKVAVRTKAVIVNPIVGFIMKNDKGLTLLGDNTYNQFEANKIENIDENIDIETQFIFTMPMLPKGEYSISVSIADGDQKQHSILHWLNDALIVQSQCSTVAAGLAGVPMQSIHMETF